MEMPSGGPYWLNFGMWLLFGTPLLFTKTAAKLPCVFGYFGRRMEARADRLAQKRIEERQAAEARAGAVVGLVPSAVIAQFETEIRTLQDGYARLERSHGELEDSVKRLRDELLQTTRQLFAVITWAQRLRVIIARLDPEHPVPEPPDLVRDLI